MVSFDYAAQHGYPINDWGNWQNEDWYDFLKDFDEPEHPELWKIDLQFGEQDLSKVLSGAKPMGYGTSAYEIFSNILEERYFNKAHKSSPFFKNDLANRLWRNIPQIGIPAQTDTNSWFSKTGRHNKLSFGSFVVLVQPKVDFVLVAIDLRECYVSENYNWSVFKPPYYVVTMVSKEMAKSWITNLLEIAHKNLPTNRSGLTWTAINELTKPKVSRLVEIRDFETTPEIKLLNWSDSSIIMDYMDVSPNPLRPFLWYLELQPAQYNSRYSEKGNWFIPYGQLTKKLFGDVDVDGYLAHQRYMLGGKKLYARTTPRNAWRNLIPPSLKESSWDAEAKTSYSSDTYGRVMNKHLCPICEGPIPNAEHEGKYPGAMSRWANVS